MDGHPAGDARLGQNLIPGNPFKEELDSATAACKLFLLALTLNGQFVNIRPLLPVEKDTICCR
jgi:hypothetical protein